MFEKESQDYAMREVAPRQELYIKGRADIDADYEKVKKIWQDGAKYGYSSANEWHYVKDGDLPKDEDWKWCVSYRGYYYVAKYEEMFGCWTNQEYSEVMQPYAWKEIVLPEPLKESE